MDPDVLCSRKVEILLRDFNHCELQKRIEALKSLGSLFLLESNTKDHFHDNEGARVIINQLRIEEHNEFVENAFSVLACGAYNHTGNQKSITNETMFSMFSAIFKHPDILHFQKMCQSALLLLLTIVNQNSRGQYLIRKSGCLKQLILLFHTNLHKIEKVKDSTCDFLHCNQNLIGTILLLSVNNPKNEKNQNAVSEIFSKALLYLSSVDYNDNKSTEPVKSCLNIFIGVIMDNKTNQDRFVNCGGISCLKRLLYALKCSTVEHPLLKIFLLLLGVLIASNTFCSHKFSSLQIVPYLLEVLHKNTKDISVRSENNYMQGRNFYFRDNNLIDYEISIVGVLLPCIRFRHLPTLYIYIPSYTIYNIIPSFILLQCFCDSAPHNTWLSCLLTKEKLSALLLLYHLIENNDANKRSFIENNGPCIIQQILENNDDNEDIQLASGFLLISFIPHEKELQYPCVISGSNKKSSLFEEEINYKQYQAENLMHETTRVNIASSNISSSDINLPINETCRKQDTHYTNKKRNSLQTDEKLCKRKLQIHDSVISSLSLRKKISTHSKISDSTRNNCKSNSTFIPLICPNENLSLKTHKKHMNFGIKKANSQLVEKESSSSHLLDDKILKSRNNVSDCLNSSNSDSLLGMINFQVPSSSISLQINILSNDKNNLSTCTSINKSPELNHLSAKDQGKVYYAKSRTYSGIDSTCASNVKQAKSNKQKILKKSSYAENVNSITPEKEVSIQTSTITKPKKPYMDFQDFLVIIPDSQNLGSSSKVTELINKCNYCEFRTESSDKQNNLQQAVVENLLGTKCVDEPVKGNYSNPNIYNGFDLQNNERHEKVINMEKSSVILDKISGVTTPNIIPHKTCEFVPNKFLTPKNSTDFDLHNNENRQIEQEVIYMERSSNNMDTNNEVNSTKVANQKIHESVQGCLLIPKIYSSIDFENNEMEVASINVGKPSINQDKNSEVKSPKVVFHKICETVQGNFSCPNNCSSSVIQNNENAEIKQAAMQKVGASINLDKKYEGTTSIQPKICDPVQDNYISPKSLTSCELQNNENREIKQAMVHTESSPINLDKSKKFKIPKKFLIPKVLKKFWHIERDSINQSSLTEEEMKNLQLGIKQFGLNFVAIRKAYSFSPMRTSKELFLTWRNELQNKYHGNRKMLEISSDESLISE